MPSTNSKTVYQQLIENLLQTTHFDKSELDILTRQFQSMKPFVPVSINPTVPSAQASAQSNAANNAAISDIKQATNGVNGGGPNTGIGSGGKVISTAEANAIIALQERVDRQKFRDLLSRKFGMTESLIMDRVFRVLDSDNDNHISFEEFVRGMSVFLKGRLEERIKYCFKIYDLNGDRYISKEEMFQILQHCLVKGVDEDEDGVKDIVDFLMKKFDEDRDGRVSEQDYSTAVTRDTLLLEVFGQSLPNPKDIDSFLQRDSYRETEYEDMITHIHDADDLLDHRLTETLNA